MAAVEENLQGVRLLSVEKPKSVRLPKSVNLPVVNLPAVNLPAVNLPVVNLPKSVRIPEGEDAK